MFLLLFILTIFLRFYNLAQFAGFAWDQEQLLSYPAKNIIVNGDLALVGPHTGPGNVYLGPLIYYLAVPFFWILKLHPLAGSVLSATLGISTALGIYILFKKLFTQNLGLLALALYAASPLFNINDRTIWNPSLIAPATVGVVAAFLSWWHYKRTTYLNITLLATATALGIQSHLGFLFILPLSLVIFLKLKPQFNFRHIAWYLLTFSFWFLPLIIFDLRHHGINIASFINFFTSGNSTPLNPILIFTRFINLSLSQLQLLGSVLVYASSPRVNLIAGLLIVALFIAYRRRIDRELMFICLSFFLIFAIGFSFYGGNVPEYYLWPILIPALLIIVLLIHQLHLTHPLFMFILIFFLGFKTLDILSSSLPPDSLYNKMRAAQYIISRSGGQPVRIDFNTDFGRYYGFSYIFDYYQFKPSDNLKDPAFTIVIPEFFRTGQRSDIAFGSIGIINPKVAP